MFFTVAWGCQHVLVTTGISNLQAAHEENKDGCFRNAMEWIHPEELGESDCFIFSDISSTSIHTHTPKAIILQEFVSHPSFFTGFEFLSMFS